MAALVLTVGAVGCDSLIEVDLPAAVTSDALEDPSVAPILVNSVMAVLECAYSSFAIDAAGMEDNFQMVSGVAGNYSQYDASPGGGTCDTDVYSQEWLDPLLTARGMGYSTYDQISAWDVADKEELLATTAIYNAVILDLFGEYFCDMVIDEGPILTPAQTLTEAEGWLDLADTHIAAAGDFAIEPAAGEVTPSAQMLADGLRARIQWARGDLATAATTAATVDDDFMAYILREDGEKRRNMVSSTQGNGGDIQAAGFLQGPVTVKTASNAYGISLLGNKLDGSPWPDPVPFTGYIDLAIETATGRAVTAAGTPLTLADAGTEADTRVPIALGPTAGGIDYVIQKYPNLSDDIPLVNWKEMRLIQAEAAGPGATATGLVNDIRDADGLPTIQGAYATAVETDNAEFRAMIIEERRRALWLEARFWSTKIQNTDLLWFPRGQGEWINSSIYSLEGGVRLLLPNDEYLLNDNIPGDLADRASGCPADQAPVGF